MKEGKFEIDILLEGMNDWEPASRIEFKNLAKVRGFKSEKIADLTIITALPNLRVLDLSHSEAETLTPLSDMENLEELALSDTRITEVSSIEGLTLLRGLDLSNTLVSNLAPAAATDQYGSTPTCRIWMSGKWNPSVD